MVESWLDKRVSTKAELQSLLGSLLYITKCVKPSRYFLYRMLQPLRDNHHTENIVLTSDFKKDLYWFRIFLKSYNGVKFYHIQPYNYRVYLDTCLTGLGGWSTPFPFPKVSCHIILHNWKWSMWLWPSRSGASAGPIGSLKSSVTIRLWLMSLVLVGPRTQYLPPVPETCGSLPLIIT